MGSQVIIKQRLFDWYVDAVAGMLAAIEKRQSVKARVGGGIAYIPYDEGLPAQIEQYRAFCVIAQNAQSVLFSSAQAEVFSRLDQPYSDSLDFRLPFSNLFLQFDKPIHTEYTKRFPRDFDRGSLLAVAIRQECHTREELKKQMAIDSLYGRKSLALPDEGDEIFINMLSLVYEDMGTEHIRWASGGEQQFSFDDKTRVDAVLHWENVVIACIGYINCENVFLEKAFTVPEAVNRKREAKGKSRLEPYYVCRIKGVQHDSHAGGEGSKHGIRYDVRGHFRRLDTGKTIWVRPHQRGLQNELYIPKVYKVEKGSKPQWKP